MNGKRVSLEIPGRTEPLQVMLYFTFGYRGKSYAAFLDEKGTFTFIDVKAVGRGRFEVIGDENVNVGLVSRVMHTILNAARTNPKEYPVNGCHYNVRDVDMGDGKTGFKAEKRNALDSGFTGVANIFGGDTTALKIVKTLTMASLGLFGILLYMLIYRDSWISFYLPKFFHDKALLVYFLVEAVVLIGVPLAIKSFRSLGKFTVLAILTLFFFSGLGALITNGSVFRTTMTLTFLSGIVVYVLGLYSSTGFEKAPDKKALLMPLKSVAYTLLLSFVIVSNAVALMLGVKAPLPKITDKSTADIESSYSAALETVHPDSWRITDEKSRVKVLQGITDKVCALELGCFVPTVQLCEDGDDNNGLIARYSDSDKTIYVNHVSLREGEVSDIVKSILTECRLAWQYYIDGMYDSISDTVDKAYLGLETFKSAVEVSRDFEDGNVYGGYAEADRNSWVLERYGKDIERYILYRNGKEPQNSNQIAETTEELTDSSVNEMDGESVPGDESTISET